MQLSGPRAKTIEVLFLRIRPKNKRFRPESNSGISKDWECGVVRWAKDSSGKRQGECWLTQPRRHWTQLRLEIYTLACCSYHPAAKAWSSYCASPIPPLTFLYNNVILNKSITANSSFCIKKKKIIIQPLCSYTEAYSRKRKTYLLIELSFFLASSSSEPVISRRVPVTATPPSKLAPAISFIKPKPPTSCFQ